MLRLTLKRAPKSAFGNLLARKKLVSLSLVSMEEKVLKRKLLINYFDSLYSDPTVAGTAVQYLALNSSLPLMIIKDPRMRADKANLSYRYGVLYDQSAKAKEVLEMTLNLMDWHDKLVIITCKEPRINLETLEAEVDEVCKQHGRSTHEHAVFDRESGQSIFARIKQYLVEQSNADNYVDFVACGNAG